ncbi:hypothetical protein [Apilactobacillus micheneri]|uniref:hypothetical protein n=1 Tax=Apilactobacillus micheneri TaxID=1899430 RepID=UPI00112C0CB7|nr:hypothetical protein [Apilactobacillus micheneri]TPR50753.1 hypothetical protein DY126_06810 [Apilactobacillus micheneri]
MPFNTIFNYSNNHLQEVINYIYEDFKKSLSDEILIKIFEGIANEYEDEKNILNLAKEEFKDFFCIVPVYGLDVEEKYKLKFIKFYLNDRKNYRE